MNSKRLRLGVVGRLIGCAALGLGAFGASAGVAAAAPVATCSGTSASPGVLAGDYPNGVRIDGVCNVNGGPAHVHGTLSLAAGSFLDAGFALNDITGHGTSSLTVVGDVRVQSGATLLLGCLKTSQPCNDDPNQSEPTLSSPGAITGDLSETDPLGVVVHNTTIGGSVNESGGGGGFTCNPSGAFEGFGSPVFSDYEDSSVGGSLNVLHLTSCWLGVARVHISGSVHMIQNQLADPDAIEILDNHIGKNLECRDNSMAWDSADISDDLYPRLAEPNQVGGTRSGQCVLASAREAGGPLGPGAF